METGNIFPDNWKEVVRGKKVIFYNTSVGSLLSGKERHIEKMKWVFNVFKEHPEAVLWWRPHPLELATIESMLPWLTQQYIEMRMLYQKENIGILDESTDLHRAIAISDAYYGDWSSVAQLHKMARRPVLYEDDMVTRSVATSFLPIALCIKEEVIWFIQSNSNKLVMVDSATYEVKKIINIPFEPPFCDRSYNYHIVDLGNRLLLLLGKSKHIYEYEIETDTIRPHKPKIENFIFQSKIVIAKNDKLLMFPYESSDILEYDYRINAAKKRSLGQKSLKMANCYEIIGEKVYMVDEESNALYQYDFISDSYTAILTGSQDSKYWGVKKTGKYFVLPHMEKKAITLWNEESGEVTELTEFPEQYACLEECAYLDMFEKNGYMYIFPFYANMILRIDVENRTVSQAFTDLFFNTKYDQNTEQINCGMYLCTERCGDYVYAYATYKACWQILNLETMNVQESVLFEIKNTAHRDLLECILNSEVYDDAFCEGERLAVCNLENYIKNLLRNDRENIHKDADKSNIGLNIYKHINCL